MPKAPSLHTIALIVAAGTSERFGGDMPKPYVMLGGKPVLRHSIDTFLSHPKIDGVRVVINRRHHMLYKKVTRDISMFPPVFGAERRQDSVRLGLEAIAHRSPRFVLIHDAARPLMDHAVIDRVLAGLENAPAALPCVPVLDTVRQTKDPLPLSGGGSDMLLLDRSKLNAAQTPQGFHFPTILDAHRKLADREFTDDIALAETLGLQVTYVKGDARNAKLTTADQLPIFEAMLNNSVPAAPVATFETRVGMGFDVHPFATHTEQKHITLSGIKIPHTHQLAGHSDADVALHALVDALLGAIGEGDIGQHFPCDDPKWKGADSKRFLLHAFELVKQQGGEITNIDLTIIGEQPKISPYREPMRQQIASLLRLDVRRVNVKATTTEKLGFLGRSEGLAAQAVATVQFPKG